MTTRKLTVLKPGKYGTRHLRAGDEFELPIREAVALVVTRKAKFVDKARTPAMERREVKVAPPQPEPKAPEPHAVGAMSSLPDMDSLRLQATQLGINVDGRWGAHRLQSEIEQAKSR